MKCTLSEIKENIQGINGEGKKTGTQINDLQQKEEVNIQPEQNEETRIQKNEESLRNLQDNFKRSKHLNHKGARKRRGRTRNWKLT